MSYVCILTRSYSLNQYKEFGNLNPISFNTKMLKQSITTDIHVQKANILPFFKIMKCWLKSMSEY